MSGPSGARPIWSGLGVQVLIGTALGGVVGLLFPMIGPDLKILGDIFLKLVKVIVAPLVFLTVFGGIIAAGDFRKVGRVSVVALIYFEIVSTLALLIGLGAGFLFGVGRGAHPAAGLAAGAQTKAAAAKLPSVSDFLLQVFPDNFFGAFTKGEILQVLMLAILLGVSIRTMGAGSEAIGRACTIATSAMYRLTHTVMLLAPIGAFGAMAFTLSTNGLHVLGVLAWWIGVYYLTQIAFIVVLHGAICLAVGVNLFEILTCIGRKSFWCWGTASSESALPGLLEKIPALGVSAQCTALVVPSGYILNLGGAAIYLSMGVAFLANMYGLHLGWAQIGGILLVMLFTSKAWPPSPAAVSSPSQPPSQRPGSCRRRACL